MFSSFDKSWMSKPRNSQEYTDGVESFIEFITNTNKGITLFSCPCVKCRNGHGKKSTDEISYHLLRHGMDQSYKFWFAHGEKNVENVRPFSSIYNVDEVDDEVDETWQEGETLVNDAFGRIGDNVDALMEDVRRNLQDDPGHSEFELPNDRKTKKYKALLEDAKKLLFPACTKRHTKLLSTIELYNVKVRHGLSDSSFDDILKVVKDLLPEENTLPIKTHEAKKMIRALGMDYDIIHACPNDCILYWGEYEKAQSCPTCHSSRWISRFLKRDPPSKVPEKVLRYFPLLPRLKRLYSVPWIAESMTWHFDAKQSSGIMRHPVDTPVWTKINNLWPEFAEEKRNVRLGLSTDGFNPFGNLSSAYSCWPVILVPYNLPPSHCMRREFSMLTLLIPGPKSPGKDIDVYLQPLIADLKFLWNTGVLTYDSFLKTTFHLKAILMWTIHDFPAYGNISGCITHGRYACPVCAEGTDAERLQSCQKFAFLGHRRGLPANHVFRTQTTAFNNKVEHSKLPVRLTSSQIKEKVQGINMKFGKSKASKRKRPEHESESITAWYKMSSFYQLPYWEELDFHHNLDVMHIEKNVGDHLLSTIMDVKDKMKDGDRAREDFKRMKIKHNLWLREDGSRPPAPFALSREEKELFCRTLHDLKVPKGYSTNWKLRVNVEKHEIKGLISHDHNVIMQHLLPVLLQNAFSKQKNLRTAVRDICLFFNVLCSKELRINDLISAKRRLIEAMCVLEKCFPPSFFDISVHLMCHLADEALACGPVWFRWMYYFERLMKVYKGYVKNFARPEGCIDERYVIEESIMYCMEYMPNGDRGNHKYSRQIFLEDGEFLDEGPLNKAKTIHLTNVQFEQVRRWVLQCYDEIEIWQKKYEIYSRESCVKGAKRKGGAGPKEKILDFIPWLRKELEGVNDEPMLKRLADGPMFKVKSYKRYRVNGFVFSPLGYEINKTTQNSGVAMNAVTTYRASAKDKNYKEANTTYYGVVKQIIELDYVDFEETVFYCDWVKVEDRVNGCKVDPCTNLIMVNMNKLKGKDKEEDEPFILASQAKQVFYSSDPVKPGWSTVLMAPKRLTKDVDALEIPLEAINLMEHY